jgi:hypothetical protein
MIRMAIDGSVGKVGVYTGSDDLPLYAPRSYLPRVLFHSDLDYPAVIATYSGTVSLGATTANGRRLNTFRVQAHGLAGIPWVVGSFTIGGVNVAAAGTVPVQQHAPNYGFARWLAMGADATDIIIYENALGYSDATFPIPATTIAWRALVTDVLL